jgi:hypothetical protein
LSLSNRDTGDSDNDNHRTSHTNRYHSLIWAKSLRLPKFQSYSATMKLRNFFDYIFMDNGTACIHRTPPTIAKRLETSAEFTLYTKSHTPPRPQAGPRWAWPEAAARRRARKSTRASHRHGQHAVIRGLVRVTAASVLQAVLAGHSRGHQEPVSIRTQGVARVLRLLAPHRLHSYQRPLARHQGQLDTALHCMTAPLLGR